MSPSRRSKTRSKNATAQNVADLAGVSRAVVSRTFSNNGSVAEVTRRKVLDAAERLGYQVNILAQSLNKQRSDLIGLVTTRIRDPYRSNLLEKLIRSTQASGYQALVSEIADENDLEQALRKFIQFRVSGVIVTSGQPPAKFAEECVHLKIPVVVINRETDLASADVVKSDNSHGAELAANSLLEAGCKHLAYLNVKNGTYSSAARGAAFVKAIAQRMVEDSVTFSQILALDPTYFGGMAAAQDALKHGLAFDGVFCANDLLACGFKDGARKYYNLDAPEDFCLIGFDDIPIAGFDSYKLTTIRQDAREVARSALALLEQRANDAERPQIICDIPVDLVTRNTVSRRA